MNFSSSLRQLLIQLINYASALVELMLRTKLGFAHFTACRHDLHAGLVHRLFD